MNDIDATKLERGDDAQPQHVSPEKRAYETPRVVTDQVFVSLDCSKTGVNNTSFQGCTCPG